MVLGWYPHIDFVSKPPKGVSLLRFLLDGLQPIGVSDLKPISEMLLNLYHRRKASVNPNIYNKIEVK